MIKTISRLVAILMLAVAFMSVTNPARAALSQSITLACNSVTISGHSSNPMSGGSYGQIEITVFDSTTQKTLVPFTVLYVDAAHNYSFTTAFAQINATDQVNVATGDQDNFVPGPNVYFLSTNLVSCGSGTTPVLFPDSRINQDPGQTVTAYCQSGGSLNVYGIDPVTSNGSLAFTVTPAEIAAVPTKPAVDTVIKSGGGATLYRLTSGELQLNRLETTGKMYAFRFSDCPKS